MSSRFLQAHLTYCMNKPCSFDLTGVSVVSPAKYVEATPRTVALRLMEKLPNDPKVIGVVRKAIQSSVVDSIELSQGYGMSYNGPGRPEISMEIFANLFPDVVVSDWQKIRPDVSIRHFDGFLTHCEQVHCSGV